MMSLEFAVAAALFAGVVCYAVLGGADFGSGFHDLTAGGARRGAPLRTLIDHSIGPVWEANHVWLIYVLVMWWTGLPPIVRRGDDHAVRAAGARARRHRPARRELRVPQVQRDAVAGEAVRRRVRDLLGARPVLPRHDRRLARLGPRSRRRIRRPVVVLDQSDVAVHGFDLGRHVRVPGRDVPDRRRRKARAGGAGGEACGCGRWWSGRPPGSWSSRRSSRSSTTRRRSGTA